MSADVAGDREDDVRKTDLEIVLGRCDSLRGEIFFRVGLPPGVRGGEVTISGTLTGPECRRATTLPVTAKLTAVPGGGASLHEGRVVRESLVARTILTEPSFWSPESPSLYRLEARLASAGHEIMHWQRMLGLRRLGIRGRSLWLDGRRHVPRGIVGNLARIAAAAFQEASLAAVACDPSEALLAKADADGVALIAMLADAAGKPLDATSATDKLVAWAWHAAVLVAVIPLEARDDTAVVIANAARSRKSTLLVAREVDGTQPPPAATDGFYLLVVRLPPESVPHPVWRDRSPSLPLVARRPVDTLFEEPSRRSCDTLQADLAIWGTAGHEGGLSWDWAGYLTG